MPRSIPKGLTHDHVLKAIAHLVSQRSQQWLRWYEGLGNAEGIAVSDLPDVIQKRLKAVVREIRKLDELTTHAVEIA